MNTELKYSDPEVLGFWNKFSLCGLQQAEQQILARYAPSPPAEVLDLGCGAGRVVLALSPKGYRVTGVDISEAMLGMARSLLEEQGFYVFRHDAQPKQSERCTSHGEPSLWFRSITPSGHKKAARNNPGCDNLSDRINVDASVLSYFSES